MELTREEDYAFRTMLEVASQPEGQMTTTARIARRRLVPLPFIRKIVPRLAAAGLLESRRGRAGGLALARPPAEISLLEILDAVRHDAIAVNRCVMQPDICPLQPTCPIHEVCRLAREQIVGIFGSVRLSQMVARGAELRARHADPITRN